MTKKLAEKYLVGINKSKVRHLTCDALAETVGVYPEIIAKDLSFFEPMLAMDLDYNLRNLVSAIQNYVDKRTKANSATKKVVSKSEIDAKKYKSIGEFVYKKMTINGIVDKFAKLSDEDLEVLSVLIENELQNR